jgi:hypothetical protein
MQAAIMPFICDLQQWGLTSKQSLSKNRPTLESVVQPDRRGRSVGESHRRRRVDGSKLRPRFGLRQGRVVTPNVHSASSFATFSPETCVYFRAS